MGSAPATWTWKQSQNAPCHRHTLRYMLFSVWLATTRGSSRGLHTSYSPLVSILPRRGPARNQSRCHLQRGCHEGFQNIKTGMHDSSYPGVCWLHQTISVGDWCIQRSIGGSVVAEAGRWVVTPHCLWQQGPDTTQGELSLHQIQLSGTKVGSYRAL